MAPFEQSCAAARGPSHRDSGGRRLHATIVEIERTHEPLAAVLPAEGELDSNSEVPEAVHAKREFALAPCAA